MKFNKNNFIPRFISRVSPSLFFRIAYYHHRKKIPNLSTPQDLSEIWIKRLLDGINNKYYLLADKYSVRDYVKKKGCEEILPTLLNCFSSGEQFNLDELPSRFALKATWGAGMNLICIDKSKLDEQDIRLTIDSWLNAPECSYSERHYNLIERRVICEEFIDDGSGGFPVDYKFICLKGSVRAILVCNGRESGHADYIPYDANWHSRMDYCIAKHDKSELLPRPKNLDEMIDVASKLATGIDMVRVDLYSNGEKIWFGEMTLTPDGCIFRRWSQKAIDEMGEYYRTH